MYTVVWSGLKDPILPLFKTECDFESIVAKFLFEPATGPKISGVVFLLSGQFLIELSPDSEVAHEDSERFFSAIMKNFHRALDVVRENAHSGTITMSEYAVLSRDGASVVLSRPKRVTFTPSAN